MTFSNQDLRRLIVPLVIEQFLAVTIGISDTIMVSSAGEAAVSGVALVDSINILLINIFSALGTGGAIVASQYLGRRDRDNACLAARQLVIVVAAISTLIGIGCAAGDRNILQLVFGSVTAALCATPRSTSSSRPCPTPSWRCITLERPSSGPWATPRSLCTPA